MKPSLFFILSFVFLGQVLAADPVWMVKVVKNLSDGGKITGTGYIVRIGSEIFVRTTPHVTLGSTDGVQVFTNNNNAIAVVPKDMITDNMLDDQLIRISGTNLTHLATYSPTVQKFVIEKHTADTLAKKTHQKVIIGDAPFMDKFYLSPQRLKRKIEKFRDGLYIEGGNLDLTGEQTRQLFLSKTTLSYISRVRVIPGESGSPFFGLHENNSQAIFDHNGIALNVYDRMMVVDGHVLGFHRLFVHSRFLSSDSGTNLVNAYLEGKRGSLNDVEWKFQAGISYRSLVIDGVLVEETHFDVSSKAGDGTAGNGGDGTAGNGGDGTAGNGGDGTAGNGGDDGAERPSMGMVYNSNPVYAFKVANYLLAAKWENLIYLLSQAIPFIPVGFETPVKELILSKNTSRSEFEATSTYRCTISLKHLLEDKLVLQINRIGVIEHDISPVAFRKMPFIEVLQTANGPRYIDYRGLWSLDISELRGNDHLLSRINLQDAKEKAFIGISGPDGQYVHHTCKFGAVD